MASSGEVNVISRGSEYLVYAKGRANFDSAKLLRDLAKELEHVKFTAIRVDLKECEWMDSTFMGVLAMLGLRARSAKVPMEICCASAQNLSLLAGLGLKKLFTFSSNPLDPAALDEVGKTSSGAPLKMAENAQTVLEAHKTLMDVDQGNVDKFASVVNLVQQDIDRLKGDAE